MEIIAGFNVIAHFGATAGLDAFKGQDLAVIGTYRENPFGIVTKANAIGLDFTFADLQYRSKKYVKRNGWQFPLYSFDNEDLLDLDCWLIEKEILQAAGRARHLRFDCDVHVYTNFMI